MPAAVVVGAQWGDEGKGKVVDALAARADLVVRFQGGNNAGHTLVVNGRPVVLHAVPSGVLQGCTCAIGNGVVLDLSVLREEVGLLRAEGFAVTPENLRVSANAHLILPYHRILDELSERSLGKGRIGTTGRGIGPAYVDKADRRGLRVGDLFSRSAFLKRLRGILAHKNRVIRLYGGRPLSFDAVCAEALRHAAWIRPFVTDVSELVFDALGRGKNVLFEGAQGTALDVDHGTYPYVTSSNTVAGAACVGAGVGPTAIDRVVGVTKAYATRVGEGPFPTEISGSTDAFLRQRGGEFGATTGRPRRCGWLDGVALRHAVRVNGITDLALTKLDVLTGLEKVRIGTAYRVRGKVTDRFPSDGTSLDKCRPVYEELPGWKAMPKGPTRIGDLPHPARRLIGRIEKLSGVPVTLISTGPAREAWIVLRGVFR